MALVRKILRALKKLFKRAKPRRRKPSKKEYRRAKRASRRMVPRKKKAVAKPKTRIIKPKPSKKKLAVKPKARPVQEPKGRLASVPNPPGTAKAPVPKPIEPVVVPVGEITHYFAKIMVCVVKVTGQSLSVGERIQVKGANTDFIQKVGSLQIESIDVRVAKKGQLVGLKVEKVCRVGDKVGKVFPGKA